MIYAGRMAAPKPGAARIGHAESAAAPAAAHIMKNQWSVRNDEILYEDDAIIIIYKPYGLPSQPTLDPDRDNAYDAVQRFIAQKAGTPYVGLHHRLDALTSGVLLMTKDRKANASIAEQFQTHSIKKTYTALCCGTAPDNARCVPGASFTLDMPIGELPGKPQKFGISGKKRKKAITDVLCENAIHLRGCTVAKFRCCPMTGRTHQIRVHLAAIGMGIVMDPFYGEKCRSIQAIIPKRMCLHAETIEFTHPLTGENMEIHAPVPPCFDAFIRKCEKLRRVQSANGDNC